MGKNKQQGTTLTPAQTPAAQGTMVVSGETVVSETIVNGDVTKKTIVKGAAPTPVVTHEAKVKENDAWAAVFALMNDDQLKALATTNPQVAEYMRAKAAKSSPVVAGQLAGDKVNAFIAANVKYKVMLDEAAALMGTKRDELTTIDARMVALKSELETLEKQGETIRASAEYGKLSQAQTDVLALSLGNEEGQLYSGRYVGDGVMNVTKKTTGKKTRKGSGGDGKKYSITVKVSGAWEFVGSKKDFYAQLPTHKALSDAMPEGARKKENFTQLARLIQSAEKDDARKVFSLAGHTITYTKTEKKVAQSA